MCQLSSNKLQHEYVAVRRLLSHWAGQLLVSIQDVRLPDDTLGFSIRKFGLTISGAVSNRGDRENRHTITGMISS